MAETAIPIDTAKATFDALTTSLTSRRLIDSIFRATPLWARMNQNMKPISGTAWMPNVQLGKLTGGTYTRATALGGATGNVPASGFSPEIATRAKYEVKYHYLPVMIPTQDVKQQGTQKLVDLLESYVKNAVNSVRMEASTEIFTRSEVTIGTGQASNGIETLDQLCWYGNTFGEIDPTDTNQETWEAHCMYGKTSDSKIQKVSPSLNNISEMIRATHATCGEKPDLVVVTEAHWQALKAQITANDYLVAKAANVDSDIVKWGFSAIWVDDIPVVSDRDIYGEDFVADQSTCVAAKGHDAYFLNFGGDDHLKLAYDRGVSFKWHENGWERLKFPYDAYLNVHYWWATIGTDMRRAHGRMVNVDPTQAIADFGLGTVRLPGADA